MTFKGISVIIPSYNGQDLLIKNLPSVFKALESIRNYEILIIDDASNDETVKAIINNFNGAQVIRNTENYGYAKSVNIGVKHASLDLIFILNNDMTLHPDYFNHSILKYFDSDEAFGVMGKIISPNDHSPQEGLKFPLHFYSGIKYKDLFIKKTDPEIKIQTLYISGGNALIDRNKFLALGGFIDIFNPFYYEDLDLSLRAHLKGWKLYYEPDSVCYHEHSITVKKYYSPDFIKQTSRKNRLLIDFIYLNGFDRFRFIVLSRLKFIIYYFLNLISFKTNYQAYRGFYLKVMNSDLSLVMPDQKKRTTLNSKIIKIRLELMEMIKRGKLIEEYPGKF